MWLAAARCGLPGLTGRGGVYVCASVKEEFGIALLEAMATGLMVVAPDGGGPATYVQDGVTGVLTQTWDAARLEEDQTLRGEQKQSHGRRLRRHPELSRDLGGRAGSRRVAQQQQNDLDLIGGRQTPFQERHQLVGDLN